MAKNDKTIQIAIDGKLLKKAFQDRNVTMSEAANNLGCGCAISNAVNRNKISKPLAIALESVYGISLEELTPKKAEPVPEKPAPAPCETCEFIVTPQISKEQWKMFEVIIEKAIISSAITIIKSFIQEGEDE